MEYVYFFIIINIQNMKAVFYAGAALMIGASIYGFADYRKASRTNEFNRLYEAEKNEQVRAEKKSAKVGSSALQTETLPGPATEVKSAAINVKNESKPAAKVKKSIRKKINPELFSRARPKEPVEPRESDVPPSPPKLKAPAVKKEL